MRLLDTNICIYVINVRPPHVLARFREHTPGTLAISTITACELAFGVSKSASARNQRALEMFLTPLEVLPFDVSVMWHYARLRTELERLGRPIGALDTMIAAHALALDATLVTNNTQEFSRVPNLQIENWV
ncbi:type II toxin-antitoxin system VapC family toxin [Acidithiobacillus sp. IBUN Pt1247-S3]|uniref:type II toxin-antitoxin system tRNA(fMet)-specific endonuclease VapC n=1 Tax=Acidithiobacillus sp. IBUN Pt1247-S3 TaxID=3166642 RepID=UPI0034E404FE